MPVNQTKDVDLREWPLEPVDNDSCKLVVTHTTIVKDLGTPAETAEHRWEAEMRLGRAKLLVAAAPTQAEFDASLNMWRQAVADARATLPAMA